MLRYLVLLLALPFIDFFILAEAVSVIGLWRTFGLVLLTGLIGAQIVRREWRFVREKLAQSVTMEEMSRNGLETVLLVLSGLLLITPGFVTDLLGASLAFRPLRERIVARLSRKLKESGEFHVEVERF